MRTIRIGLLVAVDVPDTCCNDDCCAKQVAERVYDLNEVRLFNPPIRLLSWGVISPEGGTVSVQQPITDKQTKKQNNGNKPNPN
jgi:hypothetical protein